MKAFHAMCRNRIYEFDAMHEHEVCTLDALQSQRFQASKCFMMGIWDLKVIVIVCCD